MFSPEQFTNLSAMLKDRGFNLPNNKTSTTDITVIALTGKSQQYVIFVPFIKSGVKEVRQTLEHCQVGRNLIIFMKALTTFAIKEIDALGKKNPEKQYEIWLEKEFWINPTRPYLCPQHALLSNDEKRKFFAEQKLKTSQLPKILASDPIMRYYGARRGMLVQIRRPHPAGFFYIYYRIVV